MDSLAQQKDSLAELLASQLRIALLTGAGVSTNSGIPDFKTLDHNWPFSVSRVEAVSQTYFKRDPRAFWEIYRYLFELKTEVHPNAFHRAVAQLERKDKEVIVLTQNIDGLHEKAGSSQVGELHGNMLWAFCSRPSCPERALISELKDQAIPRCDRCKKFMRPDVVLFGEEPRHFGDAKQVAMEADVLIVAGTALEVGPVNDLPRIREWWAPGKPTVWMNKHEPPADYVFSHVLLADLDEAAEVMESLPNGSLPAIS